MSSAQQKRRLFLKSTLASSTLSVAIAAGLITPKMVLAAWPKAAFAAKEIDSALQAVLGSAETTPSDKIKIKAPDIAENGAVVPITINTSLPNIEGIAIIAAKNSTPLTSSYQLASNAEGYLSTRIKMGKTSDIIVIVKSNGKLYSAQKEVKVTIGGCGG
ncbi:MAG: thiosulfate oxidation carrier protein SoxY [Gammaproteobacteria bacterium]|nr:thiosulfate oxidation carrier protein SoxY [Gammaproteobacteria bacterium]